MRKNLIPALTIIIAIISACSKSPKNTPDQPKTDKIKIEIVSGNSQSDTIGNYLKDSIVIKLTKGDQPLKNYKVQFTGSGCDQDLMQEQTTNNQGIVKHGWQLSAEIGKQSLKIVGVDEFGKKADSLSAVANAIKPAHGWVHSACTPPAPFYGLLTKMSNGRLLCILNQGVIYSDDNAVTWHKLSDKQFQSTQYLTTTDQDELFLSAGTDLYYSNNQGKTWEARTPVKATGYLQATILTKKNLLFACYGPTSAPYQVYFSKDKGLHWEPAVNAPISILQDISEQKNGDIFFREQGGELYQVSADGLKWQQIKLDLTKRTWGMASDNNGNIYISQSDGASKQQLLKSTDGGKTYHVIYEDYGLFTYMRKQSNGNIYTWNIAVGINKIDATTDIVTQITPSYLYGSNSFVLANNNSLVFMSELRKRSGWVTMMYTLP